MNVLITSFGSNNSIGVAKCLKKDNFIIGTDANPPYLCNGYKFADVLERLPYYDDPLYEDVLTSLVKKHMVDCIIPIHDKEVETIAKMRDGGALGNVRIAVNSFEVIALCNNKVEVNGSIRDIVSVPEMYGNTEDVADFPVIVKDRSGVSSRNMFVAKNREGLAGFCPEDQFIQTYVAGEEYTVDCYSSYLHADLFYYSVRKRVETRSGMSVKSEIVDLPVLGEYCRKIHGFLNYKGVSNIQFIVRDGVPYFIEINPRFAGGGILTYKSGYNFPQFTVRELCEGFSDRKADLQVGNKMVRYYEEVFFNASNDCIGFG